MAKTGNENSLGTAEGAVMGRATHALHADSPVLNDRWAIHLLDPATRLQIQNPEPSAGTNDWDDFDSAPLFALNVGSLRYAEDEVERCFRNGIRQYVILGAGFDTFALRRGDLCDELRVFEVDFPDVQTLKRKRIEQADAAPDAMPMFIPVDFETSSLAEALERSSFDPNGRVVFSWMNTIPYVSASAAESTLREIASLSAPATRIVLNYSCDVPLSETQIAYLKTLQGKVSQSGEPLQSRWKPEAFESMLSDLGFTVVEHATERHLHERYFEGRGDGLSPGVPARLIVAELRT